ncbi:hypothetical protein JKY79_00880, partial [Candidatus Babeliales bacterium]|nr:hypothetical protein [Candidatus Babeliales bacterium]
ASKNIKAIIISQDAPVTSHEAIICRNSNKPIFLFDKKTVEYLKKSEPSIIDPQRGIIITEKTIGNQSIFEQGWLTHPAPETVSIIPELLVKHDDNEFFKPISIENRQSFKDIINTIKQENDAQICLKKTYELLQQLTDNLNKNSESHASEYTEQFDALKNLLIQAVQGEIHHFQEDDEKSRLKKLFFLSRIEALIDQVPTKNCIQNFSLSSLQKKNPKKKISYKNYRLILTANIKKY